MVSAAGLRVKFDDRDNVTPGWKFNEWELKGVPVRVEIGPRDLAEGKVMSVRRDTFEKAPLDIEGLEGEIKAMLDAIQTNMFEIARAFRDAHTADVHNMEAVMPRPCGAAIRRARTRSRIVSARLPAACRLTRRPSARPASAAASRPRRSSISQRHIDVERGCSNVQPLFSNTAVQKGETT